MTKIEKMVTECKSARKYKGLRKPKCDCLSCHITWHQKQLTEVTSKLLSRLDMREHRTSGTGGKAIPDLSRRLSRRGKLE